MMNPTKIILKNGILITLLIGGFFFLSKLLGLHENPYLRFFNLLFVIIGIHKAIKTSIKVNKETNYLMNLGIGLQSAAVAVILSTLGVVFYIAFMNPEFISVMNNSFLIGGNITLAEVFFSLMIEGMASAFIGTFTIMQFYKNYSKVLVTT